jgi:hypothetical protein
MFEANREKFERMADEALQEHRRGQTLAIEELLDE